jgi:PKD repeat protein
MNEWEMNNMNNKFIKAIAALILCALMLGNLPIAMAAPTEGQKVNTVEYRNTNWVVAGSVTRTNDVIYLTGNLTIPVGASLTLVNTTISMNCSYVGQYHIEVLGSLIMQHGGLHTPMNPLDFDASRITANDTNNRPYFWVRPGATFTATNSIIEYVGDDQQGWLTGGTNVDDDFNDWTSITNGSFRITIDGISRDVENLDFSMAANMYEVANTLTDSVQAFGFGGFASAYFDWDITNWEIYSGTSTVDGLWAKKSTVAKLQKHSQNIGTDISGITKNAATDRYWLDCAQNASTFQNVDTSCIGPYMQSNSVSISNCLITNNHNGLVFDSCYPLVLQNNNITDSDFAGLLVTNATNPNFSLSGVTLSNNNVIGNSRHGVAIQASTISIEAFNMNVSENGYGMNFYSKGDMNANVHDNVMWQNYEATHNHATALLMWTGPTGTLTGTVEKNKIVENSCGGLWAGYQFGGTASYNTNLLIRNNTFIGNDGKETFQAINKLDVKVYDNFFGGSSYHGEADGMRIGFRHGDTYDFAPADTYVKDLALIVANNVFDYGNMSDAWGVGGAVLTAARNRMDATVTGNTLWGGSDNMGGIFRLGWPHPFEACEGDPRFKRVTTLNAYVAFNKLTFRNSGANGPNAGGVINFFAEDTSNVVCSDNQIYTEGGNMGTLIGVNFGAGWAGEYTVPCRNVNAIIERNTLTINISQGQNHYLGGFIRVYGFYRITATIRDNDLHRIWTGVNTYSTHQPWIWLGHPDDDSSESDSRPIYIDATITGNKLKMDLDVTPSGSTWWYSGVLIRAWAIMEVKAKITDNDIQVRYRFSGNQGCYFRLGSAIRLHAYGTVDAEIVNNNILVSTIYNGTTAGYGDLGGIINIGPMDPTPAYVKAKIVGNTISVFDNSTQGSTAGSVIRIHAQARAELEITDNKILLRSFKPGNTFDIGEVFRVWKCVDLASDFNVPQEIEMDLHRNNVKAMFNYTSPGSNGGVMRLHGLTSTVLRMTDNVFQINYTNPAFASTPTDFGVRVGYHCYNDGILSNNVDVTTRNNVIGPGGVGSAFVVGGGTVNLDMDGDTISGALYGNCGDLGYFSTEHTYGNGITLMGNHINANIRNVKILNNEGAGLYVDTAGDANIFLNNCEIRNNSWHGVMTKGFTPMTDMGRVNNTRVLWNGNDTDGNFGDLGSGAYAINSKIVFSNCTFNNPNGSVEFNSTDVSHITALNTAFTNQSRVSVDTNSIFLRQWFMNLKVQQLSSGNGIPFADVDVTELGGAIAYDSQVGADGWWRWMPMSQYMQDATTTTTLTPHTVVATKGTETGNANPVMTTNRDVVITLDYTSLPPVANAGPDQTVNESTVVTFDASASTDDYMIVNYTWTCASLGFTGYGINPTFNVTTMAGAHNVTLTVTDVEGYTANDYVLITVVDSTPPVANAGPDQIVNEDALMTFNGAGSTDNLAVTNYTWTFGVVTLQGVAPTYTFAQPGIYTVMLTVSDAAGLTSTDTMTVTVLDVTDPVPNAGAPQVIAEGVKATFDGSASTDNVGITSYTWTFNDGSNDIVRSGATFNYTFKNRGNFTVTLSCADAMNNIGTSTTWIRVEDQTPPAVLVVAPGESLTGVPVSWSLVIVFTEPMNTSSVEAAFSISGGITVTNYSWDATHRYVTIQFNDLAFDTTYTFTISTNATDLASNHLATAYTGTFRTMAAAAEETVEPETNFFTNNWWILVVIIVVLAVLLLLSLLRGGKKEPEAPIAAGTPPAPPAEPAAEPAPEAPAEEEIQ